MMSIDKFESIFETCALASLWTSMVKLTAAREKDDPFWVLRALDTCVRLCFGAALRLWYFLSEHCWLMD